MSSRPANVPVPTEAYAALVEAMRSADPSCRGDDRFTADTGPVEPLAVICRSCPLYKPCKTLARSSNAPPAFGVLGGIARRAKGKGPSGID